jgi:hypothetical protein
VPRTRCATSRASRPLKIRLKLHDSSDECRRAGAARRYGCDPPDHGVDRRRDRHHVAGDDDQGDLHREGDQIPEAGAEPLRGVRRRRARPQAGHEHDRAGGERERERIREPVFEPCGEAETDGREREAGWLLWRVGHGGYYRIAAGAVPDVTEGCDLGGDMMDGLAEEDYE